jgi:hypothetical protein
MTYPFPPDTLPAEYAWQIDRDFLAEEAYPEDGYVGLQGPRNAPANLLFLLSNGGGVAFRIRDDDGEVYYIGRIVFADPDDRSDEAEFGPLYDFAGPNDGATEIQYRHNGRWVTL